MHIVLSITSDSVGAVSSTFVVATNLIVVGHIFGILFARDHPVKVSFKGLSRYLSCVDRKPKTRNAPCDIYVTCN